MPRNNQKKQGPDRFANATNVSGPTASRRRATPSPGRRFEVRIIGGEWRGRKLHFPQSATVRPTPDRVRETLFNWLQLHTQGSRCLDLFAGSGALGCEALSRGARETIFVERDPAAARQIMETLELFGCERGRVEQKDAFAYLAGPGMPFDIVFVDPPYDAGLLPGAIAALEQGSWLHDGSLIYLEDAASNGEPALPPGWSLLRSKRAGDVGYHLARREAP
jgi:16S rRNA (guanine966-N2)-methyltransferase